MRLARNSNSAPTFRSYSSLNTNAPCKAIRLIRPEFRSYNIAPGSKRTWAISTSNTILFSRSNSFLPSVSAGQQMRFFASGSTSKTVPATGVVQFKLTDVGEGIAECELIRWYVKEGDRIKQFDKVCEVQSDKANVEITSRYDGVVKKLYAEKGQLVKVGAPLIDIDVGGSSSAAAAPVASASTPSVSQAAPTPAPHPPPVALPDAASAAVTSTANDKVLATPAVRRIAREHNVNLQKVRGSGRDGRVMKEDILAFLEASSAAPTATSAAAAPSVPGSEEERLPVRGLMRTMVKTMTASAAIPQLGFSEEIRVDALHALRSQLKEEAERAGMKLTFLPFIIKATSLALARYPILNASLSADGTEIIYKRRHNIGIAMDTPAGLIVPNIKDVAARSLLEVARELNRLQKEAQEGKLTPADLQGGTFSLSNIGTIAGTYASPLILPPEVAIAAIGRIQTLPRFDADGRVVPQRILCMTWSADHRIIDGATIANFATLVKRYLEEPASMLLHLK